MPAVKKDALPEPDPKLLERAGMITPEELAAYLKKAPGTLYKWAARGYGPEIVRVGHDIRYWPADVKAWLDENRSDHKGAA
jgi:hypothetical protein